MRLPGLASPVIQNTHSEKATSICTDWVTSRMVLREKRSASVPASGPTTSAGKKFMNAARPSQVAEWVITYTTYGTVTLCIQFPVLDTRAALENTAKSR